MHGLPSGTITFLFTDVEGSTKLLHELGERAYAEALAEHRRILRDAFARHGGVEVDTQGDAFFVAFPTAPAALDAAFSLTEALAPGPIRVRVGVHTGTPLLTDEGYVGTDVHRAARIAAAGHGGQILVSSATASLVDLRRLSDLGEHRFKDLAAPERVYQVGDDSFPSLKSLYRTNLPIPATPFLGRMTELMEVGEMLARDETRLLTLIGPGGTGKTRLAIQVAAESSQRFPDGIWWVPLAPVRDPTVVGQTVAGILGVKPQPGTNPEDTVVSALAGRQALVMLDNCEHLLPHVAETVRVLRDAGEVKVLVTSRERLRLGGEQVWPVPPLSATDGPRLFTTRARGLDPSFVPSPQVDELCARLDQLPLAIELAAARTSLFTPAQILDRLAQRLDLLTGDRDADPRQRTLRATVEWSYDLLAPDEQDLFLAFSAFAGGCSYEAVEEICASPPDLLQSLIDKSLVRRRDDVAGPRFWMLETVREFSADRLAKIADASDVRRRHAAWYAARAARLSRSLRLDEPGARDTVTADLGNLRAALAHALEEQDPRLSGDCLFGLWFYWLSEGMGNEALTAAERWLNLDWASLPDLERLPGLVACGEILRTAGSLERAAEVRYEDLDIGRRHPTGVMHGWELRNTVAATLSDLAYIEIGLGNGTRATELASEAIAIRRDRGDPHGIGHALNAAGAVALFEGDVDAARSYAIEGVDLLRGTNDLGGPLAVLIECDLRSHDLGAATEHLRTAITRLTDYQDVIDLADVARLCAWLARERGDMRSSAVLLGAFSAILASAGIPLTNDPLWLATSRMLSDELEASIGVEAFEAGRAEGAGLGPTEVAEAANVVVQRTAGTASDPSSPS